MKVLWNLLPVSLLTIPVSGIAEFLQKFVAQLERPRAKVRPRQIDRMREMMNTAGSYA